MHAKPLARRGLIVGHTSGDECRQLLERHRLALEIAHVQIEDVEWMDVRIDKPRKHQAATQLLEPSLRPYEALCTGRRANENDLAAAGRERLGGGVMRILRVDLRIADDEIRGGLGACCRAGDSRKKSAQRKRGEA